MDDFLQEAPRKVSPVFCCVPITIKEDALYFSAEVPQRAEGERPELCDRQRWEAVFRRERRPVSLDRFFRFRHLCAGAGSVRVRERRSAPALIFY